MMRLQLSLLLMFAAILSTVGTPKILAAPPAATPTAAHLPAPVDEYAIATDGGLIYDPLRREALKTGQLAAYASAPRRTATVSLGGCRLDIQVPKQATAYDVVPIPYTLSWKQDTHFPIAVEAVGFEDAGRGGKDLYDLSLPHNIDLGVQYLGSVTASNVPALKQNLTADFSDKPGTYPGFVRQPQVRSGVVASGDLVWFKFHLVNKGDTILGADGLGGSLLFPELLRKDASGVYQHFANAYNLYYRNLHYWYPGEAWDPWICFRTDEPGKPYENYHLPPGEYKVRIRLAYRNYKTADPLVNEWDGPIVFTWDQPITVENTARQAAVPDGEKQPSAADYPDKLPTFLHTFEQFMTAFDMHNQPPTGAVRHIQGVLNLQVAPWTRNVIVKLIGTGPAGIRTLAIPIAVNSSTPRLAVHPDLKHVVLGKDGRAWPTFMSQLMSDMRANVQLGPDPAQYVRADQQQMKSCGVNVLATTAMPWLYADKDKTTANYPGDAWKYALDVARQNGMQINAWAMYPPDRAPSVGDIASWITGQDYRTMESIQSGYGIGAQSISPVDPRLGAANAALYRYNFRRWGDLFYQEQNGAVPLDLEDTRGWLRQDVNVHFPVGTPGTVAFRKWVEARYGTLAATNAAWGTSFALFDAIDPETRKADALLWSYKNQSYPFHDWNQAMEDFDEWRTETRVSMYRDVLKNVRREIPSAKMAIRTEGSNVLVDGLDPESPNAHIRQAYYSQRRIAMIAKPLVQSGLIGYHSDYITLPYTPSELRPLVRAAVKQGIVPAYLPQFNDMRDIAINDRYGTNYQIDYNLPAPKKGYMMHVLTASFPWYKIMDEEGGIPGILWQDFQCDGYVTETQIREMQFFQQKLHQALDTTQGKQRLQQSVQHPSQAWRKGTRAMHSYILSTDSKK